MASSWNVFFGYHNDTRSNKHQILKYVLTVVTACMLLFDNTATIIGFISYVSGYRCMLNTQFWRQWLTVSELLWFPSFHLILLFWDFSPLWNMWTGSGAHLPPIQCVPGFFPMDKWARVWRKLLPSSAVVKYDLYVRCPVYALMPWTGKTLPLPFCLSLACV